MNKKYDRSGRSSGTAIIAFETTAEATRAKKQFDGILAKGNDSFPTSWTLVPLPQSPLLLFASPLYLLATRSNI